MIHPLPNLEITRNNLQKTQRPMLYRRSWLRCCCTWNALFL